MSRTHKKKIPPAPNRPDDRIAELELELVRERARNQRQGVEILRLQRLLEQQREENEKLKREGLRQATPFARRKRVEVRKKPGRKAGVGVFHRREKPRQVDRTKKASLYGCPECGGHLKDIHGRFKTLFSEILFLIYNKKPAPLQSRSGTTANIPYFSRLLIEKTHGP